MLLSDGWMQLSEGCLQITALSFSAQRYGQLSMKHKVKTHTLTNQPRAAHFKATRQHHSSESAEDYTELIHDLIETHGEARVGEIARQLGISHVTALRTIQRLQQSGFVTTSKHAPVTLTKEGLKIALFAKERHRLLVEFLVLIGVPRQIAEIDIEGAEHHISKRTLKSVAEFVGKKGKQ